LPRYIGSYHPLSFQNNFFLSFKGMDELSYAKAVINGKKVVTIFCGSDL